MVAITILQTSSFVLESTEPYLNDFYTLNVESAVLIANPLNAFNDYKISNINSCC